MAVPRGTKVRYSLSRKGAKGMAKTAQKDGFEVYRERSVKKGWRWRLRRKGRIVADSGESYTRRSDAIRAAKRLRTWPHFEFIPVLVTLG